MKIIVIFSSFLLLLTIANSSTYANELEMKHSSINVEKTTKTSKGTRKKIENHYSESSNKNQNIINYPKPSPGRRGLRIGLDELPNIASETRPSNSLFGHRGSRINLNKSPNTSPDSVLVKTDRWKHTINSFQHIK